MWAVTSLACSRFEPRREPGLELLSARPRLPDLRSFESLS